MSKATQLIPKIIKASNKKEAIELLVEVLEELHLSESYTNLVKVRDNLKEYQDRYKKIIDSYRNSDKEIKDMISTRLELNFLYSEVSAKFSYVVNKNKILFEEIKTQKRAEAIKNIKEDPELQKIYNVKSASAIRDIIGADSKYQEYIANSSISYALWKELDNFLSSIRQFIDLLASSIRSEQTVIIQDAK